MTEGVLQFTVILPKGLRIPETQDNLSQIVDASYLPDGKTKLTIEVAEVTRVQLLKIIRV